MAIPTHDIPSRPGPHPDRLLPADPDTRSVARELLAGIEKLPLVSVHGHVEVDLLVEDRPFPDPATLLVGGDHYVLRALHGAGVPLDGLGRGPEPAPPEAVWEAFCHHWPVLRGSATGLWLTYELATLFDVAAPPRPDDFAPMAARLQDPDMRPRALFRRFGLEVLSTTDAPGADLAGHRALQTAGLDVVPTLRPDALTDAAAPGWPTAVEAGGATSLAALCRLLRAERLRTRDAGALATDHGHATPHTEDLGAVEAEVLFARCARRRGDGADRARLAGHLLTQMGVMALEDGLVLQIHTGVVRDHDRAAFGRYGPDVGADVPVPVAFTRELRPILERCGNEPGFRMVVFTLDETTWSRELAPMASYWPGLHLGAPWWFLDGPDAIGRQLSAVAESAGYAKLSGFVDDARAFCSIPARHDVARRALVAHLARAVVEHRLTPSEAAAIARGWVLDGPRALYRVNRCG